MTFKIRRAFIWSLGILLVLIIALAFICVVQGEAPIKIGLLGFIILAVGALFAASLGRKLVIEPDRVVLHRFGRTKALAFSEVTAVECLSMRKRVFLTLCAADEFIIMSNAYGDFSELVKLLLAKVPAQSISDDARNMAVALPVRRSDIVSCWLASVLVLVILWHQLFVGG